mgnify:CR=1 FL=1
MISLTKLFPLAALGVVGAMNTDALKGSLEVLNKSKAAATSGLEVRNIADAVAGGFVVTKRLPIGNFGAWLKVNMMEKGGGIERDRSRDMWGTPYRLILDGPNGSFVVWSAGPDKRWRSTDDLRHPRKIPKVEGKVVVDQRDLQVMNAMAARYAQMDANQETSTSAASSETKDVSVEDSAKQQTSKITQGKSRPTAAVIDQNVFDSQVKRAAQGSAQASLDLAKRYFEGDNFVKKDLGESKKFVEQALKGLDGQSQIQEAHMLLEQIKSAQK